MPEILELIERVDAAGERNPADRAGDGGDLRLEHLARLEAARETVDRHVLLAGQANPLPRRALGKEVSLIGCGHFGKLTTDYTKEHG